MKKIPVLAFLLLLLFSCVQNGIDKAEITEEQVLEEFVQGSEDIPLLAGMKKISVESVDFDSNSGSIMSSGYESKVTLKRVQKFYHRTLPKMGWTLIYSDRAKSKFEREKEKLEIEFTRQNGSENIVRFFISSAL
jgi:hypothetical protein